MASNVRRLRQGRGLSAQQLGSGLIGYRAGMSPMAVSELEAGTRPLRLNEVAAIAAYFEVPVESLWQGRAQAVSTVLDEHLGAAQAADVEQMAVGYYTQQRTERLRDK